MIKLTNNPWIIRPALIPERLGADTYVIVNDFGAIAHAVAQLPDEDFLHICGPERPLARDGVTSICGPGTGLGVARRAPRRRAAITCCRPKAATSISPRSTGSRTRCSTRLRKTFTRVSAERVCAGPAIVAIYETLAEIEGKPVRHLDDKAIWTLAFEGSDSLAIAALDRFVPRARRVRRRPRADPGREGRRHRRRPRPQAQGPFRRDRVSPSASPPRAASSSMMAGIPVKLITHPQPGLYGAAAAFAQEHAQ